MTLDDGTTFGPKDSGILILFNAIKLRRDLGWEPLLSDFSGDDKKKWRCYAKWPYAEWPISVLRVSMAKKIVGVD